MTSRKPRPRHDWRLPASCPDFTWSEAERDALPKQPAGLATDLADVVSYHRWLLTSRPPKAGERDAAIAAILRHAEALAHELDHLDELTADGLDARAFGQAWRQSPGNADAFCVIRSRTMLADLIAAAKAEHGTASDIDPRVHVAMTLCSAFHRHEVTVGSWSESPARRALTIVLEALDRLVPDVDLAPRSCGHYLRRALEAMAGNEKTPDKG